MFDRQVFADAYNPASTVRGQFDLYDDSRRDGMTVERRIISIAPSVSLPTRRTLLHDGKYWMIGDGQADYYKNAMIRNKFVAHQATELVVPRTFAQTIAGSGGTPAWAARVWVKGSKEIDISSDITDVFDIYFARGESILEHSIIQMDGRYHLVRSTYPSSAGLLVALADELPEPVVVTATVTTKVYLPIQDGFSIDPVSVTALRIRWQSHFRYPTMNAEKFKPGDVILIVLKTAVTPDAGSTVVIGNDSYHVRSITDENDCWSLHLNHDRD